MRIASIYEKRERPGYGPFLPAGRVWYAAFTTRDGHASFRFASTPHRAKVAAHHAYAESAR